MKALRARLRLSAAPELENVEVVNRNTYSGPRGNSFIYIGRGTPLGNQWSDRNGTAAAYKVETRQEAVSRFNDWLADQIANAKGPAFTLITELKDRVAAGEKIKLACSCAPELCHGDVTKATIELLIHNERHPNQPLEREELQLNPSSPEQILALSARAEQAQAEVLAIDSIADDIASIYVLPEGITRAEHASRLNDLDQFAREAYERGATLTENVLSIPRDPDSRPRDETKVTIGTEAHAISFVRSFIDDPKLAEEKGKLLFEIADKACGQWMESDGRLTVFNHIYTEIRQDKSGAYRDNEQKAQVIDQVLAETAEWAQPLPEPLPDPTPEEVHEYTLAFAEENRAELEASLLPTLKSDLREIQLEPEASSYIDHLNSSTHGLATLGELAGFTFENSIEDENQIYAEMFEAAIGDSLEYATHGGDHLGAERENSTSITLDASYDRINLSALPPQLPDTLRSETRSDLLDRVLPIVDTQLERGASKTEILTPLYESNREREQLDLTARVSNTFARAGHDPLTVESTSRVDQLNAVSSLRILVRAEYVEATKGFSREAIQFAKANYRVNADWLRSQGKLEKGEYRRIVTSQKEERIAWLQLHPGEKAPTRAEITKINNLERAGQQLNAIIAGLNPTPPEQARALDQIQSRLASSKQTCETLLQNYAAAEQTSRDLAAEAVKYAQSVRATPEFQQRREALLTRCRENSVVEREWLVRENNGFFGRLNNLDANSSRSARSEVQGQTPILSSNELLDQILPLENKFISRDVNLEYLWYQAQSPGGLDLPLLSGIEEYDGRFYPLEPFLGLPSTLGPDNGFPSPKEAQTFIDNFSQQRDPDEQQLLNLYHEIGQSLKDELQGPTNTQIWYEDWLAWENTQIGQFQQPELTQTREPFILSDATVTAIEESYNEFLLDAYEYEEFDQEEHDRAADEYLALNYQTSNYPELTGEPVAHSAYAKIAQANHNAERDARLNLNQLLISPQIKRDQATNDAHLASYREVCTHLCGQNISGAGEAREALSTTLQGIERASAQIDTTRIRFGINNEPLITTELGPSPTYVSLASNSDIRIAIDNPREHHVLITTAQQCRLETTTWSSLYSQHPLTGYSRERADVNRFISEYIDFRLKDHTTQQLSDNSTFRDYSQRLATAKTPEEMIQTSSQIKLENYEFHQQLVAHRADPANVAPPVCKPLTVMEMRALFLSTTPSPTASKTDRAEMRSILHSMAVFGKEKEERVKLLAEGKLTPSPTLAKLLANLESRQTVAAVNHFYRSLRTPADQLLTKNTFDLHKAHARLPQYERDYLHRHAITQRYALLNAKEHATQVTPEPVRTTAAPNRISEASKTALYREYYGRADWLEAQKIVTTTDVNIANNLNRSTIVPELTDLEVHSISYVVNNFDQNRQEQVAEYLKSCPDERRQAMGDMITVAGEVKNATSAPDIREVELQLPTSYTLAPNSVTAIVDYTQNQSDNAVPATRLPATELSELRQEAQAQTWHEMERVVIKDASLILDAPASTLYQAQELSQAIQHIASLQERARTAFQAVNTHIAACVNKVERTFTQLAQSTDSPFRNPEQQETTRELVKIALDPKLQTSALIKANSAEYSVIQQTLTPADRERAMHLREYAANTRAEYLSAFPELDRNQQSLNTHETPAIQSPAVGNGLTTVDRYTLAREQITRTALGETAQSMVQQRSLPELPPEQIATLTVNDLIPQDVRNLAFEQAREPAWQSLEPYELRDDSEGRQVPEPLLTLANDVMDRVAVAQTIELQIDKAQTALNNFVAEQIAIAEAPVREQRAVLAYDEQFRQTLNTLATDTNQPERSEAARQVIETLEHAELDQATLVSQAETQQLDSVTANVVLEANEDALERAQQLRIQPIATTAEARTAVEQTAIAELHGPTLDRYVELRGNLDNSREQFQSALKAVDDKSAQLDLARTELSIQSQFATFKEISRPAAVQINDYLKDTVRNEGLPALLDPTRTNEHANQFAEIMINTAHDKGITLITNRESAQEVTAIANNLFNSLANGIERANSEHALNHQLTHQYEVTSHLNQQTCNELVVAAPTGSHDHAAHASLDQSEQERRRDQLERQKQPNISTKLTDQSGRQPSANDVAKTQEIAQSTSAGGASLGTNAAELGGSVEDLAAVLVL
ncbi:MAG: DUF4326 domain-containing protein [Acidobacteria bacterium]|nr:DUF4326 domain-containing protein [Acidobacteriota bacterium]